MSTFSSIEEEMSFWGAEVDSLRSKIASLEDFRRWRPMTEHPVDDRDVLFRSSKDGSVWLERFEEGEWSDRSQRIHMDYRYSWTYIPGQEPAEETK